MAAAPARAALLAALFAAALAPAPPEPPSSTEPLAPLTPASTLQRSRRLAIEAVDAVGGAGGVEGAEAEATLSYSEAEAEAEAAGVPAWRELWQASLDALRREPTINNTEEEVPVQLGAVAFLHCPVRNLGERGVSWVRRRDWHIISSGVFMYTNDERFQGRCGSWLRRARMAAAPARAALLAALFAAALAPAPPEPPSSTEPLAPLTPASTLQRSRRLAIEAVDAVGGAGGVEGAEAEATLSYSEAEAEAEAAGVPAWRELWQASLDALRREPTINNTEEEVPVQLGAVAFLHCPVRNLGERGVSWVRRRDWHIISSGVFMYTNDERFQVLHSSGSDDWVLQIKYVQKRDNGTYECQVSTAGGVLSRLVHLRLLVPEAFILGADEYHVDAGSTINLVCIIEKSPVPPQYVFWYHNARMINYDATRGVSVATAPGARTQSALTVRAATPAHSGNYSCRAPNTEPAHILVYVSEGSDKMAATLSRNAGVVSRATAALLLVVAACRTARA